MTPSTHDSDPRPQLLHLLDGFATGEGLTADAPFGHAGQRLHEWIFAIGAEIMGAGKFGPPGWQDDAEWTGWWGPNPACHTPICLGIAVFRARVLARWIGVAFIVVPPLSVAGLSGAVSLTPDYLLFTALFATGVHALRSTRSVGPAATAFPAATTV